MSIYRNVFQALNIKKKKELQKKFFLLLQNMHIYLHQSNELNFFLPLLFTLQQNLEEHQ